MIGKIISHYKILEKLGEGGMGVVYKAHDLQLDRDVALKFLPQNLSVSAEDKARFLQEARAASAVTHPNVCIIHDLAEHQGQQFIVMEYIEGKTLRQVLPVQKILEALDYAIQIGEALQEAHQKGVIHRDIKADNIMITSRRQVKVMDFGLAKLKGSLKLTRTSSTVGTLAYMAPEQIQGGEVDARSDIFSFGVVLYELLTGHLPFNAVHEAAMMYAILNEAPQPVQKYLPEVSSELMHILNRALEKDPAERYQSLSDILIELNRIKRDTSKFSHTTPSVIDRKGFLSKHRFLIGLATLLVVLITGTAYLFFFRTPLEAPVRTLAVLPFHDLTSKGADADEMWRIGMTDAIIGRLTAIRNLAVRPTSAVLKYATAPADPEQMALELDVESVLDGTFQRVGGIIRVSVQLVDCETRSSRWAKSFDLQADNMLKFQDEVAQKVVEGLSVQMTDIEKEDLVTPITKSPEAYNYYLEARFYSNTGNFQKAEHLFQLAVDKDPYFADAYVYMSYTYSMSYDARGSENLKNPQEKIECAQEAAEQALRINPRLADGYCALGATFWVQGRTVESIENLRKATELAPNLARAWYILGQNYHNCGLLDQAELTFHRAYKLDPTSYLSLTWHAQALFFLGHTTEAEQELREGLSEDADNSLLMSFLGQFLYYEERFDEAEPLLRRAAELWWPVGAQEPLYYDATFLAAYLYASTGEREKIDVRLFKLKPEKMTNSHQVYRMAGLYALLNERNIALTWLRRAVDLGYHNYPWYLRDKNLDKLRSDPEFQRILTEVRGHWERYKKLFAE